MDARLRAEIMAELRQAMKQSMEVMEEKWLTGEELTKQFGMFTKSWLKTYGHTLPRVQAVVRGSDGEEHRTGWAYPQHKIQSMISDGRIKLLRA